MWVPVNILTRWREKLRINRRHTVLSLKEDWLKFINMFHNNPGTKPTHTHTYISIYLINMKIFRNAMFEICCIINSSLAVWERSGTGLLLAGQCVYDTDMRTVGQTVWNILYNWANHSEQYGVHPVLTPLQKQELCLMWFQLSMEEKLRFDLRREKSLTGSASTLNPHTPFLSKRQRRVPPPPNNPQQTINTHVRGSNFTCHKGAAWHTELTHSRSLSPPLTHLFSKHQRCDPTRAIYILTDASSGLGYISVCVYTVLFIWIKPKKAVCWISGTREFPNTTLK